MLKSLHVSDVGTITNASITPGRGMTAITGETGAGKSMLLEALAMIGGARRRRGVGAGSVAEGVFSSEDGDITLRRVAGAGRGGCLINGDRVKASNLRETAEGLFIIHGQSAQLRLAEPSAQLSLLDSYASDEGLIAAWRDAHGKAERLRGMLKRADDPELQDRIEFLHASIGKADRVKIKPGELSELRGQADRMDAENARRERIMKVMDELDRARSLISSAATTMGGDETLRDMASTLEGMMTEAGMGVDVDDDGNDVDTINDRIADIESVIRRHGGNEESALSWLKDARAELSDLEDIVASCEEARSGLADAEQAESEAGMRLHKARTVAASAMSKAVGRELSGLSMPGAGMSINVALCAPSPTGMDEVGFLFSPYEGAEPKPMGMTASGGELSRLMLAVELVSAEAGAEGDMPTMVFDEVDAGVGGRAATALGKRLARLAESTQVIVVTHLAQVAAHADVQYAVSRIGGDTTVSRVEGADRVGEIARMMGDDDGPGMIHARAMLERCRRNVGMEGE